MPSKLTALAALALLVACSGTISQAPPESGTIPIAAPIIDLGYEGMEQRTVHVERVCLGGGADGWGSGVVVGEGVVATAKHVIDDDCLYFVGNELSYKKKIHPKSGVDMGLLYFEPDALSAETYLSSYYLGQPVVVMGYPYDKNNRKANYSVSRGFVIADYPGKAEFRFSAPIAGGNSGGPVFDEYGYLLGLVTSTWCYRHAGKACVPFDGHYYAVPATYINDLLKDK